MLTTRPVRASTTQPEIPGIGAVTRVVDPQDVGSGCGPGSGPAVATGGTALGGHGRRALEPSIWVDRRRPAGVLTARSRCRIMWAYRRGRAGARSTCRKTNLLWDVGAPTIEPIPTAPRPVARRQFARGSPLAAGLGQSQVEAETCLCWHEEPKDCRDMLMRHV